MVKPQGGLWTTPLGSTYGWKQWCTEENFQPDSLASSFIVEFTGRAMVIDTYQDLRSFPWVPFLPGMKSLLSPDWEHIKTVADGIWLTEQGQRQTRWSEPNLYGWDCESFLVLNPTCIVPVG
jgi:hypothetical protein